MKGLARLTCVAVAAMAVFCGCESGGGGGSSGDVVGSWRLTSNEGVMVYVFNSDGTMQFQSTEGSVGATGTWSGGGSDISGTWQATSSGMNGTIAASISGGTMTLDFIEASPPKTVHYSGGKL